MLRTNRGDEDLGEHDGHTVSVKGSFTKPCRWVEVRENRPREKIDDTLVSG
jgi:hypothetical protein